MICLPRRLTAAVAGLLPNAVWAGDIDRQWRRPSALSSSGAAPQGGSTALSSEYGQYHIDS